MIAAIFEKFQGAITIKMYQTQHQKTMGLLSKLKLQVCVAVIGMVGLDMT